LSNIVSYSKICTFLVLETNVFKDFSKFDSYQIRIMKSCKVVLPASIYGNIFIVCKVDQHFNIFLALYHVTG